MNIEKEIQLLKLLKVTNLNITDLLESIKGLKMGLNNITKFYLCCGSFPCLIVDRFIVENGFDSWYSVYRNRYTPKD